jgi:hypothetical protein
MGVGVQRHDPAALPPGNRPRTHRTEGWGDHRDGLNWWRKSRLHRASIPGPYSPQRVAMQTAPRRATQWVVKWLRTYGGRFFVVLDGTMLHSRGNLRKIMKPLSQEYPVSQPITRYMKNTNLQRTTIATWSMMNSVRPHIHNWCCNRRRQAVFLYVPSK